LRDVSIRIKQGKIYGLIEKNVSVKQLCSAYFVILSPITDEKGLAHICRQRHIRGYASWNYIKYYANPNVSIAVSNRWNQSRQKSLCLQIWRL